MRGLLHRLAARAAGSAVTLRSDARLPFGGGDLATDAGEASAVGLRPIESGTANPSSRVGPVPAVDEHVAAATDPRVVDRPLREGRATPSVATTARSTWRTS